MYVTVGEKGLRRLAEVSEQPPKPCSRNFAPAASQALDDSAGVLLCRLLDLPSDLQPFLHHLSVAECNLKDSQYLNSHTTTHCKGVHPILSHSKRSWVHTHKEDLLGAVAIATNEVGMGLGCIV